jgi:hypothetical protein
MNRPGTVQGHHCMIILRIIGGAQTIIYQLLTELDKLRMCLIHISICSLWLFDITMENCPFVDDL